MSAICTRRTKNVKSRRRREEKKNVTRSATRPCILYSKLGWGGRGAERLIEREKPAEIVLCKLKRFFSFFFSCEWITMHCIEIKIYIIHTSSSHPSHLHSCVWYTERKEEVGKKKRRKKKAEYQILFKRSYKQQEKTRWKLERMDFIRSNVTERMLWKERHKKKKKKKTRNESKQSSMR